MFLKDFILFLQTSSPILWILALMITTICYLIIGRCLYYTISFPDKGLQHAQLNKNKIHHRFLQRALQHQCSYQLDRSLRCISGLISLCPLIGLLGTILNIIQIFESDLSQQPRHLMMAQLSTAVFPTLLGLSCSLLGFCGQIGMLRLRTHAQHKYNIALERCCS